MSSEELSKFYDSYYFAHGCGRPYQRDDVWLAFFDSIADRISKDIQPKSVLDVGCAWGFLVEKLRLRGVEAFGTDISTYAIQNIHPDIKSYCWIGSATDPFPQKYDLITSIEVLEHIPKDQAESAIENMCSHSNDILFSSTPFDYKEVTHFNVQPPEYWGEMFASHGFFRDVDFDASFITPWAARYKYSNTPLKRVVRDYERKFFLLWKENVDLRDLSTKMREELVSQSKQIVEQNKTISNLEQQSNLANAQLQTILTTRSWQLVKKLQRIRRILIPPNSFRERLFFKDK